MRSRQNRRCATAVDPGDPALPVAGTGSLAGIRKSRTSRWRVGVLVTLHLAIAAHATHFLLTGRTLSPVEPSESMYTLELGVVNAGFVFFAATLLATLVFGRFVCGWGCHLVALQDLCGWIMKRLGIRPRPFRSRLLAFGPLTLALYMFVWPTFKRWLPWFDSTPFPGFTNGMMTAGFWDTFAGPVWAVLTLLTCGFAAVYFLGAKGFCTYGCPYGAFFAGVERLSPGRIRVTDACEQCGHCTATCTSNVRVHEEVRLYGMVVSPGCMKCMDCVSVCPKGALYFGFGRPSILRTAVSKPVARRYDLGRGEEVLVALVGLAATLAFRGLYDGPPLLMAIGLGAVTAFVALILWRLFHAGTVRLQNLLLKQSGRLRTSGVGFALIACAWLLFSVHSGFVQWHRVRGAAALERTEAPRGDVLGGNAAKFDYSKAHERALASAHRHFALAHRLGLRPVLQVELGLAWTHMLRGEVDAARDSLLTALRLAPDRSDLRVDLATLLLSNGRENEAIRALEDAVAHEPESFPARFNLGGMLRRAGKNEAAIEQLGAAVDLQPGDRDAHVELGLALMEVGRNRDATRQFVRAIEIAPDHPESRYHLPGLIRSLEPEPEP